MLQVKSIARIVTNLSFLHTYLLQTDVPSPALTGCEY